MRIRKMPRRQAPRRFQRRLQEYPGEKRAWWKRVNWPLWIGALLTLGFILAAVKGPEWAPKNPMQEHYDLEANGQVQIPPYSPLAVPGYPLGTDSAGRDLLSRILWGIRPTFMMVTTVALVRLALGILIGLWVGWSRGRRAETLDTMLSWALSVPVLIVGLVGITLVGIHQGVLAFIFGLALNGWAETARLVSGQVRIIKGQTYIEASQALGASSLRILVSHVLRQVLPFIWMLLAFEISGTLLVSAELGFLGYYIGGGIWVEVSDFAAVNIAGLPELGQMLATALVKLTNPAALVVVGATIFAAVLGFNLLGEGLRIELEPQRARKRSYSMPVLRWLTTWFNETISEPAFTWFENHILLAGTAVVLLSGLVVGWRWQSAQPKTAPLQAIGPEVKMPGDQLWASQWRDSQATQWSYLPGIQTPKIQWFFAPAQLTGGPVVNADGSLILPTQDQRLVAINPDGSLRWETVLPAIPVGTPALGPQGNIYITDISGGLSAFTPAGGLLWQAPSPNGREATSGPVVASDGTIYFTAVDVIEAFQPDGKLLWQTYGAESYTKFPPRLSAGETFLFLHENGFAADNGLPQTVGDYFPPPQDNYFGDPTLFVGANSGNYFRRGHSVFPWSSTTTGVQVSPEITWDYRPYLMQLPAAGGAAPDGSIWLWYSSMTEDSRLVWIKPNGDLISNARLGDRQANLIGFDQAGTAYICTSSIGTTSAHCFSLPRGAKKPGWSVDLGYGAVLGGALVANRLYVTGDWGGVFAIGDK